MVLGDHVEVLRQGTVGDEACTFLYADHMPRAIEVRGQQARIRTSCRFRVPREDLELVSLTPVALIRTKSRNRRTTGRLFQEFGSRFQICLKVRNESSVPACRSRAVGCAKHPPSPCHHPDSRQKRRQREPAWEVDWAEASERTVSIRDRG